jgi:DNA-binding MarR family transcriptional regulator
MNAEASGIPDAVVDALLRASRTLTDITARSLSSVNEEVTLAQFRTLQALSTHGSQTVTALAERLDVHASTMTRMCSRLVTRGFVARTPSAVDRREVVIELSGTGSEVVTDVMQNRRSEFDLIVQRLSVDEQRAVIDALDAFSIAAGSEAGHTIAAMHGGTGAHDPAEEDR